MILINAPQMEALYWIIESVINKTDYKGYLHQRKKVFVNDEHLKSTSVARTGLLSDAQHGDKSHEDKVILEAAHRGSAR